MGPALAQTGLQGDCNRKSPGSAGHIFQKHRIASEAAKQHFAACGGVACLAGNAYYNPDLHTMPLLAERLFKAGKDDMLVGRLVTAMNSVEAAGCHKAVFVWDGISPSAKRAENSGSPDFLARARTSAYVSRAFARLRASGQAPTKMEVVDHMACYEGEAAAAKLCALYGWAFVDQDSDAFAMVQPHQKVTRFVDGYTNFEITSVNDLLDGSGYTQKSLCMRWAMIGYDLDRAGVPGVGCVAAAELLDGNPTPEEVWRRYAQHSVRQPGVTSAMLQRQFAVAELFLAYAYVYNPLTGTMESLSGSEPPAELVAVAGGQGVCDAVRGVTYSDALATKLFDVDVNGTFFSHLHEALANRMPDPSGVLMRSTITSITTTEFEALLLAVPTDDKDISPDVKLPAILQGYSRSNLVAAINWSKKAFTDFAADVEAGRPCALPTVLSMAAAKTLAARLKLEEDPAAVQALVRLAALGVERPVRAAALRSREQYGAVLTVLELCTGSAAQADAATVASHFSKIQGFDTAAVEAAQQQLVRVLDDVMHGRIEMLPPDVPPELLHVIAAAAAPQHLQDLQDRLADLCAVDYIHKKVDILWSEDADLELARLAVSRWDGQQNFFQVVGEDVPDAELPAALQSHAATTRMNRLYKLVAKMGQVDSEVYPPLTALRGALKDAPDYIIAIGSRLQGWDVSKDAALVQWVFEQPHPTAPTKECRGRYWTPSPAELDDVSDDSLRTRFLHHLLPLAKEPAEAGESAAVQQLRAQLKDLNEHGPYFLPWEDEFDESIVDHVEERLSKNARMTVTTMERHGAALENVPHTSRSIMHRYTSTLLASARKPAQLGESHAITRLRPLVPAIDLLPIKKGSVDEDNWSPEEDVPYIAALEKAVRHTLTLDDCERGIDGLPGSSADRLRTRQYRLQIAASRPTSEVEPWAVTRMREFLPVIRATRKSNTAKTAWAEHEDVAAVAYACETVEAGETLHNFPIGADAAAKAKSTEAGAHAIAGLEQRSMKAVVRHIDTALLPRALVNPDAEGAGPPDTIVAPLRATLTSAALAKGAALLTMRTVTSLNLLLPSRRWERSSEGKPSITEDDVNNPNLTYAAMDVMIKSICKPPLKRPPVCGTKDDSRSFLLKNIEKVKVTQEVGRALVKGHSGSRFSPGKPVAEQLLERFRSLPRD